MPNSAVEVSAAGEMLNSPVENDVDDRATVSDGQGGKRKKSQTPKTVAFIKVPPSHLDEMAAAILGPRPPDTRPCQLAMWRQRQLNKKTQRSMREAWTALSPGEQQQVLARYPKEVTCGFAEAPKAWVAEQMHAISKTDYPEAYAARLEQVKYMWRGFQAELQHRIRDQYGRRKKRLVAAREQHVALVAPQPFFDAGHSEADWAALVAASTETPGTTDADGKSVFDWVELQRLASLRDGHQTTEYASLLSKDKAVEGVDAAHIVWKQRRKWTNKAIPDAFRQGEWSGKEAEWECMTAVQQQTVLEGWCKRTGHAVPLPMRISDKLRGNRGRLKERRIKPLKRISDKAKKHRSRTCPAIRKLLMSGHRSIEIAFNKFQSSRIQKDLMSKQVRLLGRADPMGGGAPENAAHTAQYLNQPSSAALAPPHLQPSSTALAGESSSSLCALSGESSSRDVSHAFLPAVEPTCAGVFSAILPPVVTAAGIDCLMVVLCVL